MILSPEQPVSFVNEREAYWFVLNLSDFITSKFFFQPIKSLNLFLSNKKILFFHIFFQFLTQLDNMPKSLQDFSNIFHVKSFLQYFFYKI